MITITLLNKFWKFFKNIKNCKILSQFWVWTNYQKKIKKQLTEQEKFKDSYLNLSLLLKNSPVSPVNMLNWKILSKVSKKLLKENTIIYLNKLSTWLVLLKKLLKKQKLYR